MTSTSTPSDNWSVGDLVFAKIHGFPPWPARIDGMMNQQSRRKYKVYFFGTYETGWCPAKDLTIYSEQTKDKMATMRTLRELVKSNVVFSF